MSSNSTKPPTNIGLDSTVKLFSGFKDNLKFNSIIIVFTLTAVGLFIGAFVQMSKFVGGKDDWNAIQPQITKILILSLVGTFALMGAALLYYIQDPAKVIYFLIVVICLSLGLSFSALATAVISR
jgi:hypothetical protein